MAKLKTVAQFKKVLDRGVRQMKQGKSNVWLAAQFAVTHYSEHGDHGPLNEVLSALRGTVNLGASAYVAWVQKYTDQKWDKDASKLVRDDETERTDRADIEGAISECFWNNVKNEIIVEEFDGDAFYAAVLKVVTQFENTNRKVAVDDASSATVVDMRKHITAKAPGVVLAA
jgi:hypothetical protein